MTNPTIPTIAIMAGAATPAEFYDSLAKDFESIGYPTVCKDPPSITAEDATTVTVDVDVAFVRDSVLGPLLAKDKDVILLCHSYGGTYGAGAVQGLSKKERVSKGEKGGVIGIIYIASFCTEPGESALQTIGVAEIPSWIGPGDKPGTLIFTDATHLWPSLPTEAAAVLLQKLKPCATAAISTPISYAPYKDANYDNAIAYVYAEDDAIITPELRQSFLDKSGIRLVKGVKAGHGINLEAREEVMEAVMEYVEQFWV